MAIDHDSPEYASLSDAQRLQLQKCGRLGGKRNGFVKRSISAKVTRMEPELELHGTVIARFVVPGRAVPWQTHGRPHPALRKWQETVAKAALVGFKHGQRPYQGSVELDIAICLVKSKNSMHPDLTNCVKAIEDAMQGVVFLNDRQVKKTTAVLYFSEISHREQEVEVEVSVFERR